MDGDDDTIDYGNDDPEDEEGYEDTDESEYGDENPDDEKDEVDSYDSEINEIIPKMTEDEDVDLAKMTMMMIILTTKIWKIKIN